MKEISYSGTQTIMSIKCARITLSMVPKDILPVQLHIDLDRPTST